MVCDELPGGGNTTAGGGIRESGMGCGDGHQAFDADAVGGECGLADGVVGDVVAELLGQPGVGSGGSHGPVVNSSIRTSR